MGMRAPIIATLTAAAVLIPAGSVAAPPDVTVSIRPHALLLEGGAAVSVSVKVSCPAGREVLEAFVSVGQNDDAVTGTAGLPVVCDGSPSVYTARVEALEGSYQPGKARASAFVLVLDQSTGTTEQGQDGRTVRIVNR
jgi:hypothetical protein